MWTTLYDMIPFKTDDNDWDIFQAQDKNHDHPRHGLPCIALYPGRGLLAGGQRSVIAVPGLSWTWEWEAEHQAFLILLILILKHRTYNLESVLTILLLESRMKNSR